MGQLLGYARVSTQDQDASLQVLALEAAGCSKVFIDQASGSTTKRPELDKLLAYAREGDTLVVWRLDRLGRSTGLPLETQEEWQHILIDARYTCTLFDGVNRFYVAEEHRAVIGPRLSMPANPKDRALSAKTNQIMAELADVTKELNAQIQQLRQELDRSAREVVALRQTFSWRITKPLRVLRSGCRRQPK